MPLSQVDKEVEELKLDIARLGVDDGSGKYVVKFGKLFDDPKVEQFYEALLGTLKAAKKRGVIDFKGQMLLKGAHDDVRLSSLPLLASRLNNTLRFQFAWLMGRGTKKMFLELARSTPFFS